MSIFRFFSWSKPKMSSDTQVEKKEIKLNQEMSTENSAKISTTRGEESKTDFKLTTTQNQNEVDSSPTVPSTATRNTLKQQSSSKFFEECDDPKTKPSEECDDQKVKKLGPQYSPFILLLLEAQENGYSFGTPYTTALREIQKGQKTTHWIWYVWPSHMRVRKTQYPNLMFSNLKDVLQYASHPTLVSRLCEITKIATEQLESGIPLNRLFGAMAHVDAPKFWECISMFTVVALVQNKTEMFQIMKHALEVIQRPLHQLVVNTLLQDEQNEEKEKEHLKFSSASSGTERRQEDSEGNDEVEEENVVYYEDARVMSVRDAVKFLKEKGY